jgi:hypothetical protein
MGHKDTSVLATNYAGSRPTKDIPLLLSDPTQFASTGFAGQGMAGFNIYSAMSEEQRAALGDQEFKKLIAAGTVDEAEKYAQLANIDPEVVKQGIAVQAEIDIFRAQQEAAVKAAKTEAQRVAKRDIKVESGKSLLQQFIDIGKPTKLGIGLATAGAAAFKQLPIVGGVMEAQAARAEGASMEEALFRGAAETFLPISPSDQELGEQAFGALGSQMQEMMESPQPDYPKGQTIQQQVQGLLGTGGGFSFN